eukprot:INCI6342.1.p1 GENE.INCI6342.1~~INCI6342.1.p1  ORF type:complete len:406 (+),score=70.05 INCI6342.1:245-1462(+)
MPGSRSACSRSKAAALFGAAAGVLFCTAPTSNADQSITACPETCEASRARARSCDEWVHNGNGYSCPELEEAWSCDCRGCACGSDIINTPAIPALDYRSTGFSIHVMQFRSSDPEGDPNPPVLFSVDISPEAIATKVMPSGYTGYSQSSFEKYAWCGCSCASEAGRQTKQDTAVTAAFGAVGISVLGRTWQLECCVDSVDEDCDPAVGVTGAFVTCTDFRGTNGWKDKADHTCSFYEDNGLCVGGSVVENAAALDLVLTDEQKTQSTINGKNWTTSAYVLEMEDAVGTSAADACCWCGGGAIDSTYSRVCMDYYASNYYHGAYDGTPRQYYWIDPDPPHGYIVDNSVCEYAVGCKNSSYSNFNSSAMVNDMSCSVLAFSSGLVLEQALLSPAVAFVALLVFSVDR